VHSHTLIESIDAKMQKDDEAQNNKSECKENRMNCNNMIVRVWMCMCIICNGMNRYILLTLFTTYTYSMYK